MRESEIRKGRCRGLLPGDYDQWKFEPQNRLFHRGLMCDDAPDFIQAFSLVHQADLLQTSQVRPGRRFAVFSQKNLGDKRGWLPVDNNLPEVRKPPPRPEEITEITYTNLSYEPAVYGIGISSRSVPYD